MDTSPHAALAREDGSVPPQARTSEPPRAPGARRPEPEEGLRPFPWTGLTIFLIVVILIALVAVPRARLTPEEMAADRYAIAAQHAAAELQAAIEEYALDHGRLPGLPPRETESLVVDGADAMWLVRQLTMCTDEHGEPVPQRLPTHPYGPYLDEIPANPINGLRTVRVLPGGARMPEAADGSTGWIYDPSEGEARLNAPGRVRGTEARYFDL